MALLDYKGTTATTSMRSTKRDERRVSDTFRAVSLSFSATSAGRRRSRILHQHQSRSMRPLDYINLASTICGNCAYMTRQRHTTLSRALHPFHPCFPTFSMLVVETFTKRRFPSSFWSRSGICPPYCLQAEYWRPTTGRVAGRC